MKRICRVLLVSVIAIAMIGAAALPVSAASKTPGAVKGVKVTKATYNSVSLSWSKAKKAKKYEVQYKVTGASKWSTKKVASTKVTVTSLKQNTKYSFRVRGVNGKKKGKYSKVVYKKTYRLPAAVTGLKATLATEKSVSLSWNKNSKAAQYEVQYKAAADKSWKSKKTTAIKITITGLKQNTTYSFKVRGLDGPVAGAFSKTLAQKTYIMPAAVNGKSIFAIEQIKSRIKIKWAAAKNANGYEIRTWQLNSDSPADLQYSDYEEVEENKYVAKAEYTPRFYMHPNTWYEFKVRSVNYKTGAFPALKSAWSAPFYACTTTGDRMITGVEENGFRAYEMHDVFAVGVDDPLIPMGVYEYTDYAGEDIVDSYYETDVLRVDGISFPEDFKPVDSDNIDETFAGKTFNLGDSLEEQPIQEIILSPSCSDQGATGYFDVTFKLSDSYRPTITWR